MKITPASQAPRVIGLVSCGPEVIVITALLVIMPPWRRSDKGCLKNCMETGPPILAPGSSPNHFLKRAER